MNKKNNILILIIALIILALVLIVSLRNENNKKIKPVNQSELELDKSLEADSIIEINQNLENIDLTEIDEEEFKIIDQELENL